MFDQHASRVQNVFNELFSFAISRCTKYCNQRVCVSVCPLAYIKNHMSKFSLLAQSSEYD